MPLTNLWKVEGWRAGLFDECFLRTGPSWPSFLSATTVEFDGKTGVSDECWFRGRFDGLLGSLPLAGCRCADVDVA